MDVAASWGVGAHVTVLYPFVHPHEVDQRLLERLAGTVRSVPAFHCVFGRCAWFGHDVLWLAPEPEQPFRELTAAVWAEFPDHPPYRGVHEELVPHLTVGERSRGTVADLKAAEAMVNGRLPLRAYIDRVALIAGTSQPDSWRTIQQLPLRRAQRQGRARPEC